MNFRTYSQADTSCAGFINQIPLGIKIILLLLISATLVDALFSGIFTYWFQDLPLKIFKGFQLWRLFFTQFIESLFGVMFMIYIFSTSVVNTEKKLGTVVFLLDFFFKNFMIQVVFLILSLIIQVYTIPSRGLWNIYLVYLSLQCYANPEGLVRIWFFPCQLPGKYVPIIYGLIGFAMNQSYDPIAALIFGYIEAKFFNSMMFRPSQSFIKKIENSNFLKRLVTREDFHLMQQNLDLNPTEEKEMSERERSFQGKGIKIGGGDNFNFENIIVDNSEYCDQDGPSTIE
ncbi:unnamed protein product (macronuclear) [Paramecium tetraurelia]|uniref:Derlin n=1 Tax=Paramecium tetraurelia TaxID=5888 RepID=A0BJP5_PARTE|nr:uncharacterized protein GSPATT00029391001 [Paramecium tetraurelia]CAK58762.1 unnamed protein product [Paramecium tetraurelia]|eukprot:XP_001426160.1 hypothetical protein (macronuclear) [Paramecium tetraurelia strain d4-2]